MQLDGQEKWVQVKAGQSEQDTMIRVQKQVGFYCSCSTGQNTLHFICWTCRHVEWQQHAAYLAGRAWQSTRARLRSGQRRRTQCFGCASDDSKARNEMLAGSQALKNLEWLTLQPVGHVHKHPCYLQGGLLVAYCKLNKLAIIIYYISIIRLFLSISCQTHSDALPVEILSRHRLLPNFQRDQTPCCYCLELLVQKSACWTQHYIIISNCCISTNLYHVTFPWPTWSWKHRRNRGCGMKRRKDNRCTRFHEVWYNKQGTWILYHISCATPFERRCFPPLRGHIPFHSQKAKPVRMCCHQTICFGKGVRVLRIHTTHCDCCHASTANSATKDLNYRVEGKRPFTEPTKATPVEQRCQVFLEEFLDCNSWTAWSLLLKISPCSPPWSSRKVVKWCKMLLLFIHFLCAKRYSACPVQTKQTASLRCAQYKGVALLTGYSKMQLAHRFDEAVAKCQAGKASELQVPSLSNWLSVESSNSNSKHCNWLKPSEVGIFKTFFNRFHDFMDLLRKLQGF